jgi:hypothetical protein
MAEKNLIINNRELEYSGIFSVDDLFTLINSCLEKKGYTKKEKKNEEVIGEEGKSVFLELRPYKHVKENVLLWIKIKIGMQNIVDVKHDFEGVERMLQKGDLKIIFDSWLWTDNESNWMERPYYSFMQAFIHKWIYRLPIDESHAVELSSDTAYIYGKIKRLLADYRKEDKNFAFEKDVREEIAKDIAKGITEDKTNDVPEEKIEKDTTNESVESIEPEN